MSERRFKMKILVSDLDGCIFKTYDTIGYLFIQKFHHPIDWAEICEDANHPFWKSTEGLWVREQFHNARLYATMPIYQAAKRCLWIADSLGWQIVYLTSRNPELTQATIYSLGYHQLPFGEVVIVRREFVVINKISVLEKLSDSHPQILRFIEDELQVATEYAKRGYHGWIIAQPYNKKGCSFDDTIHSWKVVQNQIVNQYQKGG